MLPVRLRGAKTHNLRGVDLDLPPGQFVALTGPSGSGKSSLAMDTLYAEGQRRFVESFSPYARQFLERMERPPVDLLSPIAATVAVERKSAVKSSRSTLATLTDIEPYLAALFGCEAVPFCPTCQTPATRLSARSAALRVVENLDGERAIVSYPQKVFGTEAFLELRESLTRDGYLRLLIGGKVCDLEEVRPSDALASDIEVIVDRVKATNVDLPRIEEAIESSWRRADGRARIHSDPRGEEKGREWAFSSGLSCGTCGRTFEPPRPALFSYNSPLGACEPCRGFGRVIDVDWDKVLPDHRKSLNDGAIRPWSGKSSEWERKVLAQFCAKRGISMDMPWGKLKEEQRRLIIDGEGTWTGGKYPGVRAWFAWLETRAYKMHVRVLLSRYREYATCKTCNGSRLNETARMYRVAGLDLGGWHTQSVGEACDRLDALKTKDAEGERAKGQLGARLSYLREVGIGYLTLDRQSRTLSGGETQRASLTTAMGALLTGTLFVLDEPTVGLHAVDIPALTGAIRRLSDTGNTVLVVEHDASVVKTADRVVELGPGSGKAGGSILFDGTPDALSKRHDLPTGKAWAVSTRLTRKVRKRTGELVIRGARANNLRGDDVTIPLGVLATITGRSGSGKSTLAIEILYRAIASLLEVEGAGKPGEHDSITGAEVISEVVLVDQSPLGRTARGNAATYTKAWDHVRALFAAEPTAIRSDLTASHFSFNAPLGRCETCEGEGYETVEMQFLADVQILCPSCRGERFRPEVLAITHAEKSIADILAMTVDDALLFFSKGDTAGKQIQKALAPLAKLGLGYLPLGQPLSTLSGGEAQRLKLSRALGSVKGGGKRGAKGGPLFILDEPSAGLHAGDTAQVLECLQTLVDDGASVVVVEHDLDVIANADWVIDMGPGGGPDGGKVVAEGAPAEIAKGDSATGVALRERAAPPKLARQKERPRVAPKAAITVEHAREHNLKDISCEIPHGALVVVTGPSGSGKSSLAFDVIYAEGQRRFMETLTPYARQFLPTLPRPHVENVAGVPPSIALEQRTSRAGANSTVATVTEIAHYLRLLFAKVGELHCPNCDSVVEAIPRDELFHQLSLACQAKGAWTVYAPAIRDRKGTHLEVFGGGFRDGFKRARVDGTLVTTDTPPKLFKTKEHRIDLVIWETGEEPLTRLQFDRALSWGDGALRLEKGKPSGAESTTARTFSSKRACPKCGTGVPELDPRWFSFNTKQGQCETCEGAGGDCPDCKGARLSPIARRVRLFGKTYAEVSAMDVRAAAKAVVDWRFTGTRELIGKAALTELVRRLEFVRGIGLDYLALGRSAATLSGGELQRLRLSAQLGSGLTGALYVLDEPTIGLHPRDTARLIGNLRGLVDTGSTVLVVEHDADVIRSADYLLDMGRGGGREGGEIEAQGAAKDVLMNPNSSTARALSHPTFIERKKAPEAKEWVELRGARANNLKDVTFRVPLGQLTVVAGVSGSGKSTLVRSVFFPALRKALGLVTDPPGEHGGIRGYKSIKRAVAVDQSPIGRTPRSVPATFLGIWDPIRALYASLPESKVRGFGPARFSFNTPKGGRCTECEGQGAILSEMSFLPEVVTPCEACGATRFEPSTNSVRYAGLGVGDVLNRTAKEAAALFKNHRKIHAPLAMMEELGIGYLQLGQGSNTLSGGEAQRLKLAAELTAGISHEPTVYVLDEPTTGLHLSDVERLIRALLKLVDRGDTLVVIEHHPDVIANADWVVELGPEAGTAGGEIVFEGAPSKLEKAATATGHVMRDRAKGK